MDWHQPAFLVPRGTRGSFQLKAIGGRPGRGLGANSEAPPNEGRGAKQRGHLGATSLAREAGRAAAPRDLGGKQAGLSEGPEGAVTKTSQEGMRKHPRVQSWLKGGGTHLRRPPPTLFNMQRATPWAWAAAGGGGGGGRAGKGPRIPIGAPVRKRPLPPAGPAFSAAGCGEASAGGLRSDALLSPGSDPPPAWGSLGAATQSPPPPGTPAAHLERQRPRPQAPPAWADDGRCSPPRRLLHEAPPPVRGLREPGGPRPGAYLRGPRRGAAA